MVRFCCIPECTSNNIKDKNLSFYCFPNDKELRAKWVEAITKNIARRKVKSFIVTGDTKVCSRHFPPSDIFSQHGVTRLQRNSVPSIFPWTKESWELNCANLKQDAKTVKSTTVNVFSVNSEVIAQTQTNLKTQLTVPASAIIVKPDKSTPYQDYDTIIIKMENDMEEDQETKSVSVPEVNQNNCRVCLKENGEAGQLYPLTSLVNCNNKNVSVIDCLNGVLKEQISTGGSYPANSCINCIQRIINAYLLIEQYRTNEEKYKETHQQTQSTPSPTSPSTSMPSEIKIKTENELPETDYTFSTSSHEREPDIREERSSNVEQIGNPPITCKECCVSIDQSMLQDHLSNCKMVQMKTAATGSVECRLFVCKSCHTLMYLEDKDTHTSICNNPPDDYVNGNYFNNH